MESYLDQPSFVVNTESYLEIFGQATPAGGGNTTTLVTLMTTGLTVAGGIVVGYLALLRDKKQKQQQDAERVTQQAENYTVGESLGRLTQAVEDLNRRVDKLEERQDRRRRRVRHDEDEPAAEVD